MTPPQPPSPSKLYFITSITNINDPAQAFFDLTKAKAQAQELTMKYADISDGFAVVEVSRVVGQFEKVSPIWHPNEDPT